MGAPVEKNLAMAGDIVLEKHDEKRRRLDQPVNEQSSGVGYASGHAVRSGSVLRIVRGPLAQQRFRPGKRLRSAGVDGPLRVPDAGEIGFAVWRARRGSGWRGVRA